MSNKSSLLYILVFGWITVCLADRGLSLDRPSPQYGGELVASARSWSPSTGIVFPQRRPFTNAGQLNYQRQDAAKFLRAQTTTKPKKMLFPDLAHASQSSSSGSAQDQGFRPSREIPLQPATHRSESITKPVEASSVLLAESFNDDTLASTKTARFVSDDIVVAPAPSVEASHSASSQSELTELVDAMEQLVERIDELESRIVENEKSGKDQEAVKALETINESLTAAKSKLESDVVRLSERTSVLEQRLSALEEFTREWVDPNILAQDSLGKVNGKRGIGRTCPHQFFPVDETDPNTPCYHISLVPNYRKNWQDASSSCQAMGAKLAEPSTSAALRKLTDYLVRNRTDQLGGGYWTGGVNPGLTWLWPSSSRSLSEIDPDMWISGLDPASRDATSGKCLRLSYDRNRNVYALQGSDCQRYLYFICEYDFKNNFDSENDRSGLEKSLAHLHSVINSVASAPEKDQETVSTTTSPRPITTTRGTTVIQEIVATTWRPEMTTATTSKPKTSGTLVPIRRFSRPTGRPSLRTTSSSPFSARTTTAQPAIIRKTTTRSPPTPNYIGVIGFKGVNHETQTEKPLNLAILTDSLL